MPISYQQLVVEYRGANIHFYFCQSQSWRRRLTIKIKGDKIYLHAPKNCSTQYAQQIIHANAENILKNLKLQKQKWQRQLNGDANIFYLGEKYHLRLCQANMDKVIIEAQNFVVYYKKDFEKAINLYYRQSALEYLPKRVAQLLPKAPWLKQIPPVKIRRAKTRWGSCSSAGNINLNTHLMKLPIACIDMVIIHELCHFKEFNHSVRFYNLMTEVLPNWRALQQQIQQISEDIDFNFN